MVGLYSGEQAVMDLWDAGVPKGEIARRTGLAASTITSIISMFDDVNGLADGWDEAARMRMLSRNLLAAIAREHPARVDC